MKVMRFCFPSLAHNYMVQNAWNSFCGCDLVKVFVFLYESNEFLFYESCLRLHGLERFEFLFNTCTTFLFTILLRNFAVCGCIFGCTHNYAFEIE